MSTSTGLEVERVSKRFGGVQALEDVDLRVAPKEIVGLIGPNGAGKTTLVNVITSLTDADSGSVRVDGQPTSGRGLAGLAHMGVARTFQHIRLFGALTVRQNIEVALTVARRHRGLDPPYDALELLSTLGLRGVSERAAGTLPYGHQRRLEIGRALALSPRYVLLDEPAAGANEAESEELIGLVAQIRIQWDCGVLVIDHDLRFMMSVCDRIYVLDKGMILVEGTPQAVQNDPKVIEVYLGSSV